MDCIWVKLNDLNKCRDAASGRRIRRLQSVPEPDRRRTGHEEGIDVTNDLSFMCITCIYACIPSNAFSFCTSLEWITT